MGGGSGEASERADERRGVGRLAAPVTIFGPHTRSLTIESPASPGRVAHARRWQCLRACPSDVWSCCAAPAACIEICAVIHRSSGPRRPLHHRCVLDSRAPAIRPFCLVAPCAVLDSIRAARCTFHTAHSAPKTRLRSHRLYAFLSTTDQHRQFDRDNTPSTALADCGSHGCPTPSARLA